MIFFHPGIVHFRRSKIADFVLFKIFHGFLVTLTFLYLQKIAQLNYNNRIEEKCRTVNIKFVKNSYKIMYFFVNTHKSIDISSILIIIGLYTQAGVQSLKNYIEKED